VGKSLRVWLLVLLWVGAQAQAAVPEIPRFRMLGVAEGLPSTTVTALARDRQGYLWMASWDGVARYDGVGFRVWRHDPADAASLRGNRVQALHIDDRDRVWVASENGGLSVMDTDRKGFRHYLQADHPEMASNEVFAITSRGDEIWFGTYLGGLHRLAGDGVITHFPIHMKDGELRSSYTVLTLAFDTRGTLWIGTMTGLARYEGGQVQQQSTPKGEPIIYSFLVEGEQLWLGTSRGMLQLSQGEWKEPAWSGMFARPNAVLSMVSDGHGEYWLGSQRGLWRTAGEKAPTPVTHDQDSPGIDAAVAASLVQPDGGLWVAIPTRGLAYLRSDWQRIAAYSGENGLGGGLYRGAAPASAGGFWLVSSIGSVERLDTATGEVIPLGEHGDRLKKQRFKSVMEDRHGRLWLGAVAGGLLRFDPANGQWLEWGHDSAVAPTPDRGSVDWLLESPDGSLWLSTLLGGVQRRDLETGEVTELLGNASEELDKFEITAAVLRPGAGIWVAGNRGLMQWHAQTRRLMPVAEIGQEPVFNLVFENAQRLWLHRLAGLESWQQQADGSWRQLRRITVADGLQAVESTGLKIGPDGRLWLASRRGLFRVEAVDGKPARVRNFGVRDGLINQELNERSLAINADGLLVGGAADGSVMLLDTAMADRPPSEPKLVLDSISVSRGDQTRSLPLQGGFEMQAGEHELQLSMRLLAYEDPVSNRYRTRLTGFDSGWIEQGASGERVFSALPPGNYTLHMQGFDAAGNASAQQELAFRVLPPWWRSAWGIALFVVLAALWLAWIAMAYQRRVRRRSAWQLADHKRELAEQASDAKTRFLATLGHEVRTPMTGVLGMSELLLDTPLDDVQRGYTQSIQRAGTHLLRLVNDALDLARIEAGKLELQSVDFDLRALLADVVALLAPVARKRGLDFSDEMAAGLPHWVRGDPLRLRQILLNLLGNAIKFTEQGRVSLRVAALPDQRVRLEICDTGPGINAEQQARLFQRFEQAEGARTTARYGGSGLGLAICQELAAAMGGSISVESTPGTGTRFIVELPFGTAVAPVSTPRRGSGEQNSAALTILLVEDDATVAEVIAGLLRARGHRVVHAVHGLAALTEATTQPFDIALLDLDLPGIDGLVLARQLRQSGFAAPLLAITARADAEAEPQACAAGFDDFLRKPITGDMLANAIERLLQEQPVREPSL
jgi:ligand-binding sensor domain-containing protein/signal transduction histidine kinase/CheY-like chemotaxis protein